MSGSRPTLGAPDADNDDNVGINVSSVVEVNHQLYEINDSTIP